MTQIKWIKLIVRLEEMQMKQFSITDVKDTKK